jgi:hypothetical protein
MRRINTKTLLNAVSAATLSDKVQVEDYRHLTLYVALAGATTTIKVKASDADDVDFSASSTISNPWYYVDLKGLGDGATTVTGSTGITGTTATSQKGYAVNIDNAKWLAVHAEVLSAGSVSVLLSAATND